jgi:hypothetical protein
MNSRFDEVAGQIDGIYSRLGRLETEYETGQRDLVAAVHRLEERLSRVETGLELLSPADAPDLREQVAEVRVRVDRLELEVRESKSRDTQ